VFPQNISAAATQGMVTDHLPGQITGQNFC